MFSSNNIINDNCRRICGTPLVFDYLSCQGRRDKNVYSNTHCDNKMLSESIKCFNQCENKDKNIDKNSMKLFKS